MPSAVDISNAALNTLGATNIISLTEDSKAGRLINQRYELVRDAVFRSHNWNSLIKRSELSQDSVAPAFGYTFKYPLPGDCLRVLEFSNGTLMYPQDNMTDNTGGPVYVIEGRDLLTDEGTVFIKYIARIEDPNLYDTLLVDTIAARLAFEICYAITGSNAMIATTKALYDEKIKEARFVDATEGAAAKFEASDLIESRF
jgi:hypothetical protein|tara:strand:- start:1329 stop:1928 length:600 start_codon:yes stop_codon:yes gene_type:complete